MLIAVAGCGTRGERSADRANLLLLTIDTLRADHCSVYGYERPTTPVLERLAREGVALEAAYAPTSTTAPTHAALLTSLYPRTTGLLRNGMTLQPEHVTLAEILRASGYRTSAVVSSFVLKRRFGFGQGFGTYECTFAPGPESANPASREGPAPRPPYQSEERPMDGVHQRPQLEGIQGFERDDEGRLIAVTAGGGQERRSRFDRRADETTDLALAWLARRGRDRPFFLWVHYFDPHQPYTPPPPFDRRFPVPEEADDLTRSVAAYDGEIAFVDQQIGRLLDALDEEKLGDQTLVIVTADHGEGLLQHGYMGHGLHLYEEAVRAPLILRWSGRLPAGARVPGPVELLDVAPTALELLGFSKQEVPFQGRSLARELVGKRGLPDRVPERPAFLQRQLFTGNMVDGHRVRGEKYGVRLGRWKYIEAEAEGTRELFDLELDPHEATNVAEVYPERVRQLSGMIAAWQAAAAGDTPAVADDTGETLEALGALGYVK